MPALADLSPVPARPRSELLREIRARLPSAVPGTRFVAEGILAEEARIDFVGVSPHGGIELLLVGEEGDDLMLVALGLAQRAWVEARYPDWLQLAPELGLRPGAGVGLVLLCPVFGPESRAAARALGEAAPRLVRYRFIRNGGGLEALLEPLEGRPAAAPSSTEPASSGFRTGLTDAMLDLSADERQAFE
jgi:hypothetical protein